MSTRATAYTPLPLEMAKAGNCWPTPGSHGNTKLQHSPSRYFVEHVVTEREVRVLWQCLSPLRRQSRLHERQHLLWAGEQLRQFPQARPHYGGRQVIVDIVDQTLRLIHRPLDMAGNTGSCSIRHDAAKDLPQPPDVCLQSMAGSPTPARARKSFKSCCEDGTNRRSGGDTPRSGDSDALLVHSSRMSDQSHAKSLIVLRVWMS